MVNMLGIKIVEVGVARRCHDLIKVLTRLIHLAFQEYTKVALQVTSSESVLGQYWHYGRFLGSLCRYPVFCS